MTKKPTAVSRRVQRCIGAFLSGDYETALLQLFPAMDAVAQLRRPGTGTGERMRGFLRDEQAVITCLALNAIIVDCKFNGMTFEQVIYKFARNPLAHRGELDRRISFSDGGVVELGADVWRLPIGYIAAMVLVVIAAPEAGGEQLDEDMVIRVMDHDWSCNELFGQAPALRAHLSRVTGHPVTDFEARP